MDGWTWTSTHPHHKHTHTRTPRLTNRPSATTEAAPAAAVVCATPEKMMAEMSVSGKKAPVARASFGASVEEPVMDTPGRRVRGAGPSSIIFG